MLISTMQSDAIGQLGGALAFTLLGYDSFFLSFYFMQIRRIAARRAAAARRALMGGGSPEEAQMESALSTDERLRQRAVAASKQATSAISRGVAGVALRTQVGARRVAEGTARAGGRLASSVAQPRPLRVTALGRLGKRRQLTDLERSQLTDLGPEALIEIEMRQSLDDDGGGGGSSRSLDGGGGGGGGGGGARGAIVERREHEGDDLIPVPNDCAERVGRCVEYVVRDQLPKDREYQMSYMTDRFSHDAALWQYVIWARQALLFVDATVSRHFIDEMSVEATAAQQAAAQLANLTAADEAGPLEPVTTFGMKVLLWAHTAVALVVLGSFWFLHHRKSPYEFGFQNAIESWLYFVNVLIILLGGLYTLLSTYQTVGWVQALIEVAMVVLLVASCLVSAAYLAYGYWGNLLIEGLSRERAATGTDGSDRSLAIGAPRNLAPALNPSHGPEDGGSRSPRGSPFQRVGGASPKAAAAKPTRPSPFTRVGGRSSNASTSGASSLQPPPPRPSRNSLAHLGRARIESVVSEGNEDDEEADTSGPSQKMAPPSTRPTSRVWGRRSTGASRSQAEVRLHDVEASVNVSSQLSSDELSIAPRASLLALQARGRDSSFAYITSGKLNTSNI